MRGRSIAASHMIAYNRRAADDPLQAVVLAVVQGVTEFLPISSSGHLILVPRLFGWPDQGLDFDVATHAGTLLAVLRLLPPRPARPGRRVLHAAAAAVADGGLRPAAGWPGRISSGRCRPVVAGLLFKDLDRDPGAQPAADRRHADRLRPAPGRGRPGGRAAAGARRRSAGRRPWLIGCAQALALVPGTSRSGITITAALLLGFTRPAAARFSFLLSVPVMLAGRGARRAGPGDGGRCRRQSCARWRSGWSVSAVTGLPGDRLAARLAAAAEPDGLRGLPACSWGWRSWPLARAVTICTGTKILTIAMGRRLLIAGR